LHSVRYGKLFECHLKHARYVIMIFRDVTPVYWLMGTELRGSLLPADIGHNSFLWSTGINLSTWMASWSYVCNRIYC